ncbi:class I adenylate-forming enzyme family protein [Marivita geojedonensis]|uniref:Benzoate--CoA ligase n=1 Tax=Marivita geojedonensis TaxID=1123756 RepID=A0A1X4NF85_9RHOB|nr:class I adenylate-forming enzyme family protein [Marivita geojedonensis]OSQ45755.1 benzoate--CoA ligase [Marivita geojedonensis]PRY74026.1 acyl-CoA synthetase (AMP-forming)/AMP-acid ligase II [Marivita geojedonensis]
MTSVFDNGQWPPCPQDFNLTAHVLAAADRLPDKIALAVVKPTGAQRWSYDRLRSAILGTATGFLQSGLSPGDRLLMRVGNSVEFPVAYLAAIAVGIAPIPTSSQLTEPEVQVLIDMTAPAAILHDGQTACPDTLRVIRTAQMSEWYGLPPAAYAFGDPERLAYIIFTSGTSGKPRAVCHAHRAIWARGMMMDGWYGLTEHDRLMHAGAFNWTYTLGTGLLDPWTRGATALIPAQGVDHAQIPLLLKRHEATIFAAAPGVYRNILKSGPLDLPKLRHGLSAGEKLPASIREAWHNATGSQMYEAFGMSECSTFISSCPGTTGLSANSLGWPQQGRRIAIVDETGPTPIGSEGIIAVHQADPGLMLGYLDQPEETRSRYQGDWFLTGDLGQMTETGEILYLGRNDDMMNAGGYRVSPLEVETALLAHPDVHEVGVTDIEVKQDTRIIAAYYVADCDLDPDALGAFAAERLARYKQPRLYQRIAALPRNANNKLMRRALPEQRPG